MIASAVLGLIAAAPVLAAAPIPFHFVPNRGQAAATVQYLAPVRHGVVSMTAAGITLDGGVSLEFVHADPASRWAPLDLAPGVTSYLLGAHPAKWLRDLPQYRRVERKAIYPGIDLVAYGAEGRLEYDFVLSSGADPARIRLRFAGAPGMRVNASGDLEAPGFVQKRPSVYQLDATGSKHSVAARYRLLSNRDVAFDLGAYDRARPLTIDPVLESATLLGGSGDDRVAAVDSTAVVGSTASSDVPGASVGPHRGSDVFVYRPQTETTLIIGGSGDDVVTCARGNGDLSGTIIIGGYTNSTDFPVSAVYRDVIVPQARYGGGAQDGFVIVLQGSNAVLATYLGGSGDDRVLSVDSGAGRYDLFGAAGVTDSRDFPVVQGWQSGPGGGTDGFVAMFQFLGGGSGSPLVFSTYLGGSGEDRALAVAVASATDFYVAGETRSPAGSLAGAASWTGSRQGDSDAFLLHARRAPTYGSAFAGLVGALWGGAGEDRITLLRTLPNGRLAVAGVTASSDFAGALRGPTDAFLAVTDADLASAPAPRLIGGSAGEEPLALDCNRFNEIVLGGSTNSEDFPVLDAIQPRFGGGDSDGFLIHFDSDGNPIWSSYYGGSGADRITAVRLEDARVFFGGVTGSADFATKKARQELLSGPTDGFYAAATVPVIHTDNLVGGKDLAARGYAYLGDAANAVGAPLTVKSVDPTRVLVAASASDAGTAAVTIAIRAGAELAGRYFYAYCLDAAGPARLQLSAPGYPDREIAIRCVPAGIALSKPEIVIATSGNGAGNGSFSLYTAALDPDTGRPLAAQIPRTGLSPIRIDLRSSDESVVTVDKGAILIDSTTDQNANNYQSPILFNLSAKAIGAADILLSASAGLPFAPADHLRVRVTGPALSLYVPTMARDFVERIAVTLTPASSAPIDVTFTSPDPAKLRLTSDPSRAGTDTLTIKCSQWCNEIYLEALDGSGAASLTMSSPGLDSVTVPVSLTEPKARFYNQYYSAIGADLYVGSASTFVYLGLAGTPAATLGVNSRTPALRAGATPILVNFYSSDPAVAGIQQGPWSIGPGNLAMAGPLISPYFGGEAVISAVISNGVAAPSFTVRTGVSAPSLSSATIGRNLQAFLTLSLPSSDKPRAVVITSSDPSRLLLSTGASQVGKASLNLSLQYGTNIVAQALGDSGEVEVTTSVAGYPDVKSTVRFAPSGVAWTSEALAFTTGDAPGKDSNSGPSLSTYQLDPVNLTPLVAQSARPGAGAVTLRSSDPSVAVPKSSAVSLNTSYQATTVELTPVAAGKTVIAIDQPEGFVAPAGRGALRVTVTRPTFVLSGSSVGRNLQAEVTVYFPKGQPDSKALPPMTVTSADSSKLLLSATATDPGAATATIRGPFDGFPPGGSPYQPFYVQAIDGPADVAVTASIPGYEDATAAIQIVPTALAFGVNDGPLSNAVLRTTLESAPLAVRLFAVTQDSGNQWVGGSYDKRLLWAGFPNTPVSIQNSNPAVASIDKDPVLNARTNFSTVTIKPLSPGETELTVVPPPGFVSTSSGVAQKVKVVVEGAAFVLPDLTIGRDLLAPLTLSVRNGSATLSADADVTIVSRDPSKVLVSASPNDPGAASVTLHLAARQQISAAVYAHALGDSGTAALAISAPGYAASTCTLTLARTSFLAEYSAISLNTTDTKTISFRPVPFNSSYPSVAFQLRPGVAPFSFAASVKDPAIASVSPAVTTVGPGTSKIDLRVQPAGAGETTLNVTVPEPYAPPAEVRLIIAGSRLSINGPSIIGKDLQAVFNVSYGAATVTSSDPSRLLVASTASAVGAASATITQGFVAQALADSGTVTLTVSGPGYEPGSLTVALGPPAVVFGSTPGSTTISPLSPPVQFTAQLIAPGASYGMQSRRAGASPLTVPILLSDANVGSVSPAALTFRPGDNSAAFTFQPRAAGSELISLGIPAGFAEPLSGRQLLLTVVSARLVLAGNLAVGKDLQTAVSASLSGAAGQAVAVTLASADPARLTLSAQPRDFGASATLNFSGSTSSLALYLCGRDATGAVGITASSPGMTSSTSSATLQPSGFRFASSSATVAAGSSTGAQIVSSMLAPGSLTAVADMAVRSDIPAPVALTVTSSNPAVVSVSSPIYFYGGDTQQRLTIVGKSAGVATLSITPPEGWSIPAGASKMTVIVQ